MEEEVTKGSSFGRKTCDSDLWVRILRGYRTKVPQISEGMLSSPVSERLCVTCVSECASAFIKGCGGGLEQVGS